MQRQAHLHPSSAMDVDTSEHPKKRSASDAGLAPSRNAPQKIQVCAYGVHGAAILSRCSSNYFFFFSFPFFTYISCLAGLSLPPNWRLLALARGFPPLSRRFPPIASNCFVSPCLAPLPLSCLISTLPVTACCFWDPSRRPYLSAVQPSPNRVRLTDALFNFC